MSTDSSDSAVSPASWNRRQFCARSMGAMLAGLTGPAWPEVVYAEDPPAPTGRRWDLFIVQHSHIDLGFTDRQEVIADYHRGFVRQAVELALSQAQRTRQPECRFKYTIEGFWSLEQFLRSATPHERRQLSKALKSGLVELTAGYFHLTELLDQELLRSTLQPGQRFARREGLHLNAAMSCDVNGFSWGFSDVLAEAGVRYLSTNINTHHGGVPFGKPMTPFYWQTPTGKRLLVWNGMTYHRANVLGLMGYYSPDTILGFPGLDLPPRHNYEDLHDLSMAERKLLPTLAHLEKTGYPYSFLPLMGSALYTDNGPAGDQCCDIIRQWNAKYGDRIHIRTATLAEFFQHLEKTVQDIPTHRGEWTDWWSDGVASTPLDTLLYRNAQRTRHLVRKLDPQHHTVSAERIEAIDQKLALYAEHTFGYSNTASHSLLTHQVFTRKTMHAVLADELAGQALVEVLRARGEGEFSARRPFTYKVLNPLDRAVTAAVALPVDYWEEPYVAEGVRVLNAQGQTLPTQVEPAPRGRVVITRVEVPAGGELQLRLEKGNRKAAPASSENGFANAHYRVAWDGQRGIYSLVDVPSGREWLAPEKGGLGCPIYQIFPKGERGEAAGFGFSKRTIPKDVVTLGRCTGVQRTSAGELLERWEFTYDVPGTSGYVLATTFYRDLPHLELAARVVKTDVTDPEGLYVVFPFHAPEAIWHLDKPGGPIRPGLDQLPGTCCDYYCVQAGGALVGPGAGLAWTTWDAPLVHIGKMRLWNYTTSLEPTGAIYSWLTNNKWETNFRLSSPGRYEFRYTLQLAPRFPSATEAMALCQAHLQPPVVVRG